MLLSVESPTIPVQDVYRIPCFLRLESSCCRIAGFASLSLLSGIDPVGAGVGIGRRGRVRKLFSVLVPSLTTQCKIFSLKSTQRRA